MPGRAETSAGSPSSPTPACVGEPWPRVDRRRAGEAGRVVAPLGGARPPHHQGGQPGPDHVRSRSRLEGYDVRPAGRLTMSTSSDAPQATRPVAVTTATPADLDSLARFLQAEWRGGSSPPRRHPGRSRTRSDARHSVESAPTWRDATRRSPASSAPGTSRLPRDAGVSSRRRHLARCPCGRSVVPREVSPLPDLARRSAADDHDPAVRAATPRLARVAHARTRPRQPGLPPGASGPTGGQDSAPGLRRGYGSGRLVATR